MCRSEAQDFLCVRSKIPVKLACNFVSYTFLRIYSPALVVGDFIVAWMGRLRGSDTLSPAGNCLALSGDATCSVLLAILQCRFISMAVDHRWVQVAKPFLENTWAEMWTINFRLIRSALDGDLNLNMWPDCWNSQSTSVKENYEIVLFLLSCNPVVKEASAVACLAAWGSSMNDVLSVHDIMSMLFVARVQHGVLTLYESRSQSCLWGQAAQVNEEHEYHATDPHYSCILFFRNSTNTAGPQNMQIEQPAISPNETLESARLSSDWSTSYYGNLSRQRSTFVSEPKCKWRQLN